MNTPKKPEPTDAEIRALAGEWGIDPARLRFIDAGSSDDDASDRAGTAALVAEYSQLTDVGLRTSTEAANGLYIAESTKIINRALAASHTPQSFFITKLWFPQLVEPLGPACRKHDFCALLRKHDRTGFADSGTCAGDHGDPAF